MIKLMTKGNGKLDKSVLGWSITPVKSCLNCKDCKKDCYAVKPYNRYPNVKKAWDRNFELAKSGEFVKLIVDQLKGQRKLKGSGGIGRPCNNICDGADDDSYVVPYTVRIHVSGDFFSQEYIDRWVEICSSVRALKLPVDFYTYTKVYDKFDFKELDRYVNIINSITPIGINFGDEAYCNRLYKRGYQICPSTQGHDVVCGGHYQNSCRLCMVKKKIAFIKH